MLSSESTATVTWKIPEGTEDGTYMIWNYGDYKHLTGGTVPFTGHSSKLAGSVSLSVCLSVSVCLFVSVSVILSVCVSVVLSVCLSLLCSLSVSLSVCLSICQSVCLCLHVGLADCRFILPNCQMFTILHSLAVTCLLAQAREFVVIQTCICRLSPCIAPMHSVLLLPTSRHANNAGTTHEVSWTVTLPQTACTELVLWLQVHLQLVSQDQYSGGW